VRDLADPAAAGEPLSGLQPQQLTPPLPGKDVPARRASRTPHPVIRPQPADITT
jgi:hypothetical protein